KGAAWAHLDIAGPMFKEKDWKYYEAGALGFGLKTLVDLSERFNDPVPAAQGLVRPDHRPRLPRLPHREPGRLPPAEGAGRPRLRGHEAGGGRSEERRGGKEGRS